MFEEIDTHGALNLKDNNCCVIGYNTITTPKNTSEISISGTGSCAKVGGVDGAIIENNVFLRQNNTFPPAKYKNVNFKSGNVDYNIYYCDGDKDIINYNNSSMTLAEWQDLDHGTNSMNVDPIPNNNHKPKDSNAPPFDEGVSLSATGM
jgi:hypothetical protein